MKLAAQLRAWRKRVNLSQSQAALKLGIPTKTLQNWEHGRNIPGNLAVEALLQKIKRQPPKRRK